MCLDKIRPDMNRFEKGWKVFRFIDNQLRTLHKGNRIKPLPENKWIHYKAWSKQSGKITSNNNAFVNLENVIYPQGWHVEATIKGAEDWIDGNEVMRKVLCRDMHTTGRQDGTKVGVCRWIKILPDMEAADGS